MLFYLKGSSSGSSGGRPSPSSSTSGSRPSSSGSRANGPSSSVKNSSPRTSPVLYRYNTYYYQSSYNYFYYQQLLFNTYYLQEMDKKEYVGLNFNSIKSTQYCPLTNCTYINDTTIRTPLKSYVNNVEILNNTKNINNITILNLALSEKYGCNINFNICLESSSSKFYVNNSLFTILIIIFILIIR